MSAEIVLHADPIDAVVVPRSVVTLSTRGALGVRIVVDDDDGRASCRSTVIDDTPTAWCSSGVPEGAQVIISGQDLVADGETVQRRRRRLGRRGDRGRRRRSPAHEAAETR